MSGGSSGLGGHIYQQRYLAFRVLSSVAVGMIQTYPSAKRITSFAIEGRVTADGPAWDVLFVLEGGAAHLRECKDTRITPEDRETFYRRIRKERAAGVPIQQLTAGWVTDPDKQGNLPDHFQAMAALSAGPLPAVPAAAPDQVRSGDTALEEALYYLCRPAAKASDPPPLLLAEAGDLLGRLVVDLHRMEELKEAVEQLASGTFACGTGQLLGKYITGELSSRITACGEARYTVAEFLTEVGVGSLVLEAAGPLADLLRFHSGVAPRQEQGIRWKRLAGEPVKVWPLDERLPGFDGSACMVTASIGGGKSVTGQQALASELTRGRNPHHALLVEAHEADDRTIAAILRLACVLCGLAPTWLCIDGLDEVRNEWREAWRLLLGRLLRLPRLSLVVTARQEVVTAHSWLQDIGLSVRELPVLTEAQVRAAFQEVNLPPPANPSLLRVLRTPLLLSLYAAVVTGEDLPLAESGEVTAFQVIEIFWDRTVLRASVGHRATGDAEQSQVHKRRAAEAMARQTFNGVLVLRPGDEPPEIEAGCETLRREGVVVREGTHACRWVHDWVREYALIDYVVSVVGHRTMVDLITEIATLPVDHVARTLALAGLKWIIARPDWGTAQQYLTGLAQENRGYTSDVLALLVEGDSRRLALADLPTELLVELIEQARLIRAWQWWQQVAALPIGRFAEDDGRLHDVVTAYEVEAPQ